MHLGLKNILIAFFHETWKWENRGQKSLGQLCNLTNYMYLCLKKALLSLLETAYFSSPLKYNFAGKSEEIAGSSFQHCMGCEGEVKRLYSRLTRAQKRQKCKFVPWLLGSRLLSMIADSRPSKLPLLWLVLNPPSASSLNGQVLHLVWCSLRSLMTLKSPKKVKNYSRKSRWFKNHAKVNAYFTDHEKVENQFPEDGKI